MNNMYICDLKVIFYKFMIDTTIFQDKTAVYYTLGCKLNFSETSTIGRILREAGIRTARKGEKADICVVNTCSVTEVADKKCRQAIHRLIKQHPGAFVVVTGCYAQLKPDTVADIEGVDVVLGAEQKKDVLNTRRSPYLGTERHPHVCPFLLAGRPHTLLPQGTGRMRLLLFVLHHSLCTRTQPQWQYRIAGGTGTPGRCRGRA